MRAVAQTIEPDIQIVSMTTAPDGQIDILLTGDDPGQTLPKPRKDLPPERDPSKPIADGQPMLLVRVLQREHDAARGEAKPRIDVVRDDDPKSKVAPVRRLVIPTESVEPEFKVLLIPHRKGDELPVSTWDKTKTRVSLQFPKSAGGGKDEIAFQKSESGKSHVQVQRGDEVLAKINTEPPKPLE